MKRMLLLGVVCASPALAQPADCPAQPVGPGVKLDVRVGIAGRPGVPQASGGGGARLDFGTVPADGTVCADDGPPPDDVLHGAPAPRGLLQGDGPGDVLHDRPTGQVVVEPAVPDQARSP